MTSPFFFCSLSRSVRPCDELCDCRGLCDTRVGSFTTAATTVKTPEPLSPDSAGRGGALRASPGELKIDVDAVNAEAAASSSSSSSSSSNSGQGAADKMDAQTREETLAEGAETFGELNQHPNDKASYKVGVSVDRNKKCRRTMEDAHSFVYDFGGIKGQGYFAVFDGHAGKHAAEWCGEHFHEHLLESLIVSPDDPVPDLLNKTFHLVDSKLSQMAAQDGTHSGCTAVVAFLRLEDEQGKCVGEKGGVGSVVDLRKTSEEAQQQSDDTSANESMLADGASKLKDKIVGSSASAPLPEVKVKGPAEVKQAAKRTLYTANVGDARAVLARGNEAVRLTYDHKGSDPREAKRITDAGGFVMNNRVNGVLAVTRSLGDSSMKEFVVGSPYTTETTLGPEDRYLILACDGLWDVCGDQEAVDLIKDAKDAQHASAILLQHALSSFSSDNLSIVVVSLM